jgi:predicted aldo/keto reductase-like oxidoreductase
MAFKDSLSRRKFISGSALALTPLALSRMDLPAAMAATSAEAKASQTIITRKLGRTGLLVPVVSMGVMNADNPAVVKESYEIGVRFFDTAMRYQNGKNEEMVGEVIKSLGVRNKVFIQTKIPKPRVAAEQVTQQMITDFEGCLKRLQMDYVDTLLIHMPTVAEMNEPGVVQAMKTIKDQKRAHFIGVSSHMGQTDILNDIVKNKIYDTVTIGYNFTQAQDTALLDAIKKASAAGIGLVAMKTQASGRRGPGAPATGSPINQTAALKWVLSHPEITTTIPGYTNFDHMKQNFSVAYGLSYTEEEKKFLAEKNLIASIQFCQQCGTCSGTCPKGVDIPTLMRTHMYAARYGNFLHARTTLDSIEKSAHLSNCGDCKECNAHCAHYVDIARSIGELKSMYL